MSGTDEDVVVFMRALGKRVRLLRLTAELIQEELSEATGISRSFVSLIDHGARCVDACDCFGSRQLGLPLHELVNVGVRGADRVEGLPS